MAKLTKKEFAEQTTVGTTKKLAVYIQRGNVKVGKDNLIDTNNAVNKDFIAKYGIPKGEAIDYENKPNDHVTRLIERMVEQEEGDNESAPADQSGIWSEKISRKRFLHFQAKKTETAEQLDRLKIQKLQGEVVPVEPISQIIFRYKQHILTGEKGIFEAFLNEITHKYNVSAEDIAYYRGMIVKRLNDHVNEATENTINDLGVVLNEFSVKRGKGERK